MGGFEVNRYDPQKHHRRSIRLRRYAYSMAGAYFVTICTQNRACLFGEIENNEFKPYPPGEMVRSVWNEIPMHYDGVKTGEFVVMPNHIHAIIIITQSPVVEAGPCACPDWESPALREQHAQQGQPQGVAPTLSLPDIVHRLKTMTTKRYADGVKNHDWLPFPGRLWQRNYYEHIIRDDDDYNCISEYIINNPINWKNDKLWIDQN
ncbi:MAG: transposase [Proteobacteria bacterium]|nr:transposase [Pseudomonadota bacterium]